MAGYSVESLLTWMKDTSRMFGWEALVALSGDKVNGLLRETYKTQLVQGVAHKVPGGSVTIPDTDVSYHFSDFILGPPVLSFDYASFANTSLAVAMNVVSGVQTKLQTQLGTSRILRLAAWEPINGPSLRLDLPLTTRAADVELDLTQSQNLQLMFAGTSAEQSEAGAFFQSWFNSPDNRGRVYPLSKFAYQGNPLLAVRSIDVRAQLEDASSNAPDRKGALLLFVTLEHGAKGTFPPDDGNFRYLIPNDVDPLYSATALFSRPALYRAAFGSAVLQLLDAGQFDFIGPPLREMVARAGSFQVPGGEYEGAQYVFQSEPFSISAGSGQQPLTAVFEADQATQSWRFPCVVTFKYKPVGSTQQWTTHSGAFEVSLTHEFLLAADDSGARAMEGQLCTPYLHEQEVIPVSGLPENLAPQMVDQINAFIAYTIKRALLERFSEILNIGGTDAFLAQWALGTGQAMHPLVSALPQDLAVFGQVDTGEQVWDIVEQQAVLAAGARLQFTTRPPREDLTWSLENAPGSEGDPGRVDDQGEYRAPPAHTMTQGVQRVLVIARDSSNRTATALVTVQAHGVSINPLIEVCNHGQQVALSAASLSGGRLDWSIRNPVAGESGELITDGPLGEHFYVAGPKVSGKTYVLDEVEARDGGQARSTWMLVRQQTPLLEVKPVADSALPAGQIHLQALFDDEVMDSVRWTLAAESPGTLDDDGLYSSDPSALQRFALVFAEVGVGEHGRFEGHLILPLPLNQFPDVLQALAR